VAGAYEHDWNKARERFQLALAAEQVPPEVRFRCGLFYLVPLGRFQEALVQIESAVEQDPLNVLFRGIFAVILGLAGMHDRAAAEARKAIEIDNRHWTPYYAMSMIHVLRGELDEARQFAERTVQAMPSMPLTAGLLAGILRLLGEKHRADELLSKVKAPSAWFMYYMLCSEIDKAADWYAKSIAQGELNAIWLVGTNFVTPLRSSPRWPSLAKMMNLPPEAV
jgi:tetratricopeptide (TPR) repeat protein